MRYLAVDDDIDNCIEQNVSYHNKSRWYDHIEQIVDNDDSYCQ